MPVLSFVLKKPNKGALLFHYFYTVIMYVEKCNVCTPAFCQSC